MLDFLPAWDLFWPNFSQLRKNHDWVLISEPADGSQLRSQLLEYGFQGVIVGKYQFDRWPFIISTLFVLVGRPCRSLSLHVQFYNFVDLSSSKIILSIFGETLTNSIYNAAPIVWQVSGDNLGRCTIRKISVPRHDPAHLDQYLRTSFRFGPGRSAVAWRAANILPLGYRSRSARIA